MSRAIRWASLSTIVVAGLLAAPAIAATNGVTVIRGTVSDAGPSQPTAGLPTALRGWAPGTPRAQPKPEPKRTKSRWTTIGGDTLWFVERSGQRIIGCWLQGSTQVGGIDVRCGRTPRR